MKFDDLHELIPFARFGKAKSLSMSPYNGIELLLPGRHSEDTSPKGGDFVVCVDDNKLDWTKHQFTHTDIFKDVEDSKANITEDFRWAYWNVVRGADPNNYNFTRQDCQDGIHPQTFLYAVQCLAVAEHRRYHQHEAKFGGRFLPFRFAAGIMEGLWTAADAAAMQKRGRPGVEILEKAHGKPELTEALMKNDL